MISLIAFLGNYGSEYEKSRHNAAWLFEASLPFASELNWQRKFKGVYAAVEAPALMKWTASENVATTVSEGTTSRFYFLKPETYMNLSGESIGELSRFFRLRPEQILVIHDELELPLGTVSLKWSGGLGGHNGLRSTKTVLGTPDFWRLRLGIGRPANGAVADYVLNPFTEDERIVLSQIFPQTASLLVQVLMAARPEKLIPEWGKKKLSL